MTETGLINDITANFCVQGNNLDSQKAINAYFEASSMPNQITHNGASTTRGTALSITGVVVDGLPLAL